MLYPENPNDYFSSLEISAIELLGYAKNNIVEAQERLAELPLELALKLNTAYSLLDGVQEYLFDN